MRKYTLHELTHGCRSTGQTKCAATTRTGLLVTAVRVIVVMCMRGQHTDNYAAMAYSGLLVTAVA